MKKIMFGMIIGFVLSLGTTTFANTDVLAKIFDVKLKVNGIEKQLNSKSYNIDGSAYVPLREIGNLTGYDVTYKADLQTIELNSSETNIMKEPEIQQVTPTTEDTPNTRIDEIISNNPNKIPEIEAVEWVTYNELLQNYKVKLEFTGTKETIMINNGVTLKFIYPETKNKIFETTINGEIVRFYNNNGRLKLSIDDLKKTGFIN